MGTHPCRAGRDGFQYLEAARRLGMLRRTLARKLEKQGVK
jgi:ActR/RegA family two-component response regulator